MLIVALVLAVIGLAALVTAVVTSNELVAWVCIAASVIGVILLIVDAIRERQTAADAGCRWTPRTKRSDRSRRADAIDETYQNFDAEYPDDTETVELPTNRHATVAEPSTATPTSIRPDRCADVDGRSPKLNGQRVECPAPPNRTRCPR